ncbi:MULTISPECIES: NAD(P)H-dependent oxidoreductase [unclassified Amycolatopsis]|uniref:FMN-dependent NADH-azoreductase n=1 Tax=unclassified Amycolatopsis TaxID=2618356 RepID=UPI0028766782|nr:MULTISPECIES: NAD(P)H-dependent oxidoreductase [unclassified Amycolatopsis]MDS0139695.1 NAD(P)H-dependent oxidoreductase [Amycolatopsis sp. 505]MDS0145118.1 NAD(P)H-dependent oxidoreductase [Amycolatopsis sp. CM201R]
MPHLLHLDSSARRSSFSRELSARYAAGWTGTRTYRDLAADPVPVIGEAWTEICDALLATGITDPAHYADVVETPEQKRAWAIVEPVLAELLEADVVLIGAPMYNFSIPAALKAWIDQVTFPKMDLSGKKFVIAGARGGTYAEGTPRAPFDHHERYLRDFIAGHYGVDDVRFVHAELTNALVDPHLAARDGERRKSLEAARTAF